MNLFRALPALEMAAKALEELDKKDITEIKSMASPPAPVMTVCQCVLILRPLGREDENGGSELTELDLAVTSTVDL